MSQQSPPTDEELQSDFAEWRALFNQYRNNGMLPPAEREQFRVLSARLVRAGCFERLPSLH